MTARRKVLGVLVVLILVSLGLIAGLHRKPAQRHAIWIDAARPVTISEPFEVVEVGANGELGLWLPAQAGRGWKGEARGDASYGLYVPEDGTYTVWAYCLWHDACTNAVYVQFDEMDKAILGNDPVFDEWHWVKGFEVELTKGRHRLRLANHSPNVSIQKLYLTNDRQDAPSDADAFLVTVLFRDDFNGCDKGNFPVWRQVSGKWEIEHPDERVNRADNVLVGVSQHIAEIFYDNDNWCRRRLTVSAFMESETPSQAAFGIRYGFDPGGGYQEIRLCPGVDGQDGMVEHLCCEAGGPVEKMAGGRLPVALSKWHELQLDIADDGPTLRFDGGAVFTGGQVSPPKGGIGLVLYGSVKAKFDNVLVQDLEGAVE